MTHEEAVALIIECAILQSLIDQMLKEAHKALLKPELKLELIDGGKAD